MKAWPPKPGLTDIIRTRSTRSITCSMVETGVAGLIVTPAFLPSARIACSERCTCGPASTWTVMMSEPALAKASRYGSHGAIIRWTSRVFLVSGRIACDHVRADRDIGHEMPVHHVDMDPVGAGRFDRAHFLAEPGEIGRQDRRRDTSGRGIMASGQRFG